MDSLGWQRLTRGNWDTKNFIRLRKFYQNSPLSANEQEINKNVSFDYVVVENCFGRLWSFLTLFLHKWRWREDFYDPFCKIEVALKNYHIKILPLQSKAQECFCGVCNRLRSIPPDLEGKRNRNNVEYVSRRRQQMEPIEKSISEDDDSNWRIFGVAFTVFYAAINFWNKSEVFMCYKN